eukprot:scaffold18892_cov64-Phaeocystis_antarctica.AAC.9
MWEDLGGARGARSAPARWHERTWAAGARQASRSSRAAGPPGSSAARRAGGGSHTGQACRRQPA